jgi:hypothetical protein
MGEVMTGDSKTYAISKNESSWRIMKLLVPSASARDYDSADEANIVQMVTDHINSGYSTNVFAGRTRQGYELIAGDHPPNMYTERKSMLELAEDNFGKNSALCRTIIAGGATINVLETEKVEYADGSSKEHSVLAQKPHPDFDKCKNEFDKKNIKEQPLSKVAEAEMTLLSLASGKTVYHEQNGNLTNPRTALVNPSIPAGAEKLSGVDNLIKDGADINACAKTVKTYDSNGKEFEALVLTSKDNKEGKTATQLALENNQQKDAEYLASKGGKVKLPDGTLATPKEYENVEAKAAAENSLIERRANNLLANDSLPKEEIASKLEKSKYDNRIVAAAALLEDVIVPLNNAKNEMVALNPDNKQALDNAFNKYKEAVAGVQIDSDNKHSNPDELKAFDEARKSIKDEVLKEAAKTMHIDLKTASSDNIQKPSTSDKDAPTKEAARGVK